MRYRKKPVVIDVEGPISEPRDIVTLEGAMRADPGDYIITGVKGETYPVKPDIFAATYEPEDVSNHDQPLQAWKRWIERRGSR